MARKTIVQAALVQFAGTLLASWWFRHALNTDAVAYLRLAEHYAAGRWELAISGYWGPLLSWLMAPLMAAGVPSLVAARVVMGISALVFLGGCAALFEAVKLPRRWNEAGVWTAALAAIPYSVGNITPDLLWAGLLAFAVSRLARIEPGVLPGPGIGAGLIWGLAFLTKAVALPLALLILPAWAVVFWRGTLPCRKLVVLLAGFGLGFSLFAAPWVTVLSRHYGKLTLTTSAAINHAIVGPGTAARYHPTMQTLHQPPPGRVTTWEDPTRMAYPAWQPWESWASAWHQIKLSLKNLALTQLMLTTIFLDWPCVLVFWAMRRGWPRWRSLTVPPEIQRGAIIAALVIGSLVLIYCPNYLRFGDQRFFYPAFPFLWLAGVWLSEHLSAAVAGFERWVTGALMASFLVPSLVLMAWVLPPKRQAGEIAHELAAGMKAAGWPGPMAGSALQPGGRTGLFVAYLTGQPWLGDANPLTPESCRQIGAKTVLINREDPAGSSFASDDRWQEWHAMAQPPRPTAPPVRVFKLREP